MTDHNYDMSALIKLMVLFGDMFLYLYDNAVLIEKRRKREEIRI